MTLSTLSHCLQSIALNISLIILLTLIEAGLAYHTIPCHCLPAVVTEYDKSSGRPAFSILGTLFPYRRLLLLV